MTFIYFIYRKHAGWHTAHWRRLGKYIGRGQTKILWGERVIITEESIGVSQLFGAYARAAPTKSTPMTLHNGLEIL